MHESCDVGELSIIVTQERTDEPEAAGWPRQLKDEYLLAVVSSVIMIHGSRARQRAK